VAIRVYETSKELGYVDIKKIQGETFVTTTEAGDKVCRIVLDELLEFAKIHGPASSNESLLKENLGYITKGASKTLRMSPLLKQVIYEQLNTVRKLNKQFGEDILNLEE